MTILEVNSAFQAVNGETGEVVVNLSKFKGTEAWDKMDKVVEHLAEMGWLVIDHRNEMQEQEKPR
jgi:hypothetical protein